MIHINTPPDPITELIKRVCNNQDIIVRMRTDRDELTTPPLSGEMYLNFFELDKEHSHVLPNANKMRTLFSNRRSPNFPSQQQKYLMEKLANVSIYTVVNGNNEIVVASPREIHNITASNWLLEKYKEIFIWSQDEGSVALTLFFINKEDASSYLHEVCKKEYKDAEKLGLKVEKVGLDFFYKLNRTSPPKVQAKLVADLKEIDLVISKYINKYSSSINPNQRYSKTWFQGNPIYTIGPSKNIKLKSLLNYNPKNNLDDRFIFFSREDALKAWKVFTSKTFPTENVEPNIEIYNLEDLLIEIENFESIPDINLNFIPPYDTYKDSKISATIKEEAEDNKLETYKFQLKVQLNKLTRFYKGLLWLVTSDTLPNEENAW